MLELSAKNIKQPGPQASARNLRYFGIGLAIISAIFFSYGPLFLDSKPNFWLLGLASFLFVCGLFLHAILRPIYLAWMFVAVYIGHIVSLIILSILFFLVITPLGIARRLISDDFFGLKLDKINDISYWAKHINKNDKNSYLKEY